MKTKSRTQHKASANDKAAVQIKKIMESYSKEMEELNAEFLQALRRAQQKEIRAMEGKLRKGEDADQWLNQKLS